MGTPLDPDPGPLDAPESPEAISADEEFDRIADAIDSLPLTDPDLVVEEDDNAGVPLGKTWAFDFVARRFITGAGGGPVAVSGVVGLRYWIEKCLRTAAGAHPIYSPEFGLWNPWDVLGQPLQAVSVGDLEQRVRTALTFHPRITDITHFVAVPDQDQEALFVAFNVVLDDDTLLSIRNLVLT